jgi:two-component system OmpR family response regulator
MRLLLIEDDEILGEGLRDYLRADGHTMEWFRALRQADAVRDEPFDAWLLDWQLPGGSGLDWLRTRRARGETTPALMLTARDRLTDRVNSLDSGADDYLIKPFAPEELAARLRAVCRRSAGAPDARVHCGPVVIDLQLRCALRGAQRVDLTAREWALLEALALRAARRHAARVGRGHGVAAAFERPFGERRGTARRRRTLRVAGGRHRSARREAFAARTCRTVREGDATRLCR